MEKQQTDLNQLGIYFPYDDPQSPVIALRKPKSMFADRCIEPADGGLSWCTENEKVVYLQEDKCWSWRDGGKDGLNGCDYSIDCSPPCQVTAMDQYEQSLTEALGEYGLTEEGVSQWVDERN